MPFLSQSYQFTQAWDVITMYIDDIVDHEASPVIVVTGDFNQLCLDCLEHDYGLAQIVTVSTPHTVITY